MLPYPGREHEFASCEFFALQRYDLKADLLSSGKLRAKRLEEKLRLQKGKMHLPVLSICFCCWFLLAVCFTETKTTWHVFDFRDVTPLRHPQPPPKKQVFVIPLSFHPISTRKKPGPRLPRVVVGSVQVVVLKKDEAIWLPPCYPPEFQTWRSLENPPWMSRCISYWKWGMFQPVMLAFWGVNHRYRRYPRDKSTYKEKKQNFTTTKNDGNWKVWISFQRWLIIFWISITSWWFQPSWTILVKLDHFPQ